MKITRAEHVKRIRAGQRRARSRGIRIGRPPVVIDMATARKFLDAGLPVDVVARRLGVSPNRLYIEIRREKLTQ